MAKIYDDSMYDAFLYETQELLEKLEQCLIKEEKTKSFDASVIDEIFRIMHTIKGSSSMMSYHQITEVAHSLEDLFDYIRDENPDLSDCFCEITDLVLEVSDFIKNELRSLEKNEKVDNSPFSIVVRIQEMLNLLRKSKDSTEDNKELSTEGMGEIKEDERSVLKKIDLNDTINIDDEEVEVDKMKKGKVYQILIYFEDDCLMKSMRAFTLIRSLEEFAVINEYEPGELLEDVNADSIIHKEGFKILFTSSLSQESLDQFFQNTPYLKGYQFHKDTSALSIENSVDCIFSLEDHIKSSLPTVTKDEVKSENIDLTNSMQELLEKVIPNKTNQNRSDELTDSMKQKMVSVNVNKLDMLMDLVGEIVIAEEILINSPDLAGLKLLNFQKSAMQLQKITNELKDTVMSIRMVPLSVTFQKMNRIVRDMSRKLKKDIEIILEGEETEVDKNIIEKISDPIMHIVRNAIDHGIEPKEERVNKGKSAKGSIKLEAKNIGGDVLINIIDDGRGLNKEGILKKAKKNGLLQKPVEEMTDKEIYSFIFQPGFSTKDDISEYSGRGVGLDVVVKNIENVGGTVIVDSTEGKGTSVQLKLPLTLAIVEGMNIKVGESAFTIPANTVKETFRPLHNKVVISPEGNEMIMIRDELYPIVRLNKIFDIKNSMDIFTEGMLIMVEQNDSRFCIFCDSLIGLQQVVVKALPKYLKKMNQMKYFGGCTLLGDGTISLILDLSNISTQF